MHLARWYAFFSWLIGLTVVSLAVIAWAGNLGWQLDNLTIGAAFPVLGLIAFSLMWSHYTLGATAEYLGVAKQSTERYWKLTSYMVLAAILLHPGLYWLQLYLDGQGLPPLSYLSQYEFGSAMFVAVVLGSLSLAAFLLYETYRWFKQRSWWIYVEYLSIAAMLAIFYHGLTLGGDLMGGWFRIVWFFYGLTLIVAVAYSYRHKSGGTAA